MSAELPLVNPRLAEFDERKAQFEQAQYEDALYGEAGKTDFSDEARNRVVEANAYERHLESLSARDESYDELDLQDGEYQGGIDRVIADSAELRRMAMIARSIAEIYSTEVTPENADRSPQVIKDKEDKLQELLIAFSDTSSLPDAQKDAIIERIINTSQHLEGTEEVAPKEVEPEEDAIDVPDSADDDKSDYQEADDAEDRTNKGSAFIGPMPEAVSEETDDTSSPSEDEPQEDEKDQQAENLSGNIDDLNGRAVSVIDEFDELDEDSGVQQGRKTSRLYKNLKKLFRDDQFAKSQLGRSSDNRYDSDGLESTNESGSKSGFDRARDAINGKLTKLYYGTGALYNRIAGEHGPREDESKEEYQRRMEKYGKISVAVGVIAVAAFSAYKISKGMDSGGQGNGGSVGPSLDQLPQDSDSTSQSSDFASQSPDNEVQATHDTLTDSSWNIPSGSGGEALMDRLGVDKSIWYENQDDFLKQFPNEAYRMTDGNVGFDDRGKLSNKAIEFWAKKTGQW